MTIIPPDYLDMELHDIIEGLMDGSERPFFVRRSQCRGIPWEVCYHGEKGVVSPVVVELFSDWSDAKDRAAKLISEMIELIVKLT